MALVRSKLYSDDVSLLVVLIDTNPFFWGGPNTCLSFSTFLSHVLAFLNSVRLLNQLNQVVVIASGVNSCNFIYDSSSSSSQPVVIETRTTPALSSKLLLNLEEFLTTDQRLTGDNSMFSLLSGSLSLALCCILDLFFLVLLSLLDLT
ncbi:hypothetical protein IFM89_000436 [Coptis chinensis]|uniref:General transcription and DNA repair factor IIH subunit TFB4 n=1 Tax=Coptis chinensis TaxID=261450 RepID=A0A835I8X7_9MAGN|nr:hypothetical protein IFM89_000436 [Coptis chinensis]